MQSTATPRQCKMLGASVRGLGVVTAVEGNLHDHSYALVETADGTRQRVLLRDLRRADVIFPACPQPYVTGTERVGPNTWDEMHSLITPPVALAAAA